MPCTNDFFPGTLPKPSRRSDPAPDNSLTWTDDDAIIASNHGYRLYDSPRYGLKVKRIKDDMFDTDTAAQTYVALLALKGNNTALKAIRIIADYHDVQVD